MDLTVSLPLRTDAEMARNIVIPLQRDLYMGIHGDWLMNGAFDSKHIIDALGTNSEECQSPLHLAGIIFFGDLSLSNLTMLHSHLQHLNISQMTTRFSTTCSIPCACPDPWAGPTWDSTRPSARSCPWRPWRLWSAVSARIDAHSASINSLPPMKLSRMRPSMSTKACESWQLTHLRQLGGFNPPNLKVTWERSTVRWMPVAIHKAVIPYILRIRHGEVLVWLLQWYPCPETVSTRKIQFSWRDNHNSVGGLLLSFTIHCSFGSKNTIPKWTIGYWRYYWRFMEVTISLSLSLYICVCNDSDYLYRWVIWTIPISSHLLSSIINNSNWKSPSATIFSS